MNDKSISEESISEINPEERAEMARNNFLSGYNCCQAVLLAFSDITGLDTDTAATIASGFGGGMARMREVCGTVTAMGMVAGFISPAANPSIKSERTANYALVQELASEFRKENGSIICRELLSGLQVMPGTHGASGTHGIPETHGASGTHGIPETHGASGPHGIPETHGASGPKVNTAMESPEPSDRTNEYYRKRPCPELCYCAARIVAEALRRRVNSR